MIATADPVLGWRRVGDLWPQFELTVLTDRAWLAGNFAVAVPFIIRAGAGAP